MTCATLGHELEAVDAINFSGKSRTQNTMGRELRDIVVMNSSRLWMA